MEHIAVVTTVSALSVARSMARALIERKLAACAHISEIESFYRWKGAAVQDHQRTLPGRRGCDQRAALVRAARHSLVHLRARLRAIRRVDRDQLCRRVGASNEPFWPFVM